MTAQKSSEFTSIKIFIVQFSDHDDEIVMHGQFLSVIKNITFYYTEEECP